MTRTWHQRTDLNEGTPIVYVHVYTVNQTLVVVGFNGDCDEALMIAEEVFADISNFHKPTDDLTWTEHHNGTKQEMN